MSGRMGAGDPRGDEALVEAAQGGDKQATEELLNRYGGLVRWRARRFFLVGGETEDLIQVGMIGLYRAVTEYRADGGSSFKNFAYRCVSERIIDAVRASGAKKNVPLNSAEPIDVQAEDTVCLPSPEDEVIRGEDRREFLQRIGGALSDFEFRVFVMYMEGSSYTEICEATGKDGKSVDNAIQRSRRKLIRLYTGGKTE